MSEINAWAERIRNQEVTPRRAELRRVGDAGRQLIERLIATQAPIEALEEAALALEQVVAKLDQFPRGATWDGFREAANAGDVNGHFDHSPLIGRSNPVAPPITLSLEGKTMIGTVRFGSAYEGPPGCVHGGFIAASFDEVLGAAQNIAGGPAMTGTLTIRYRKPTPLHTDLRFECRLDDIDGRKKLCSGKVFAGDIMTAEAEGIWVTVADDKFRQLHESRKTADG